MDTFEDDKSSTEYNMEESESSFIDDMSEGEREVFGKIFRFFWKLMIFLDFENSKFRFCQKICKP